MTHIVGVGPHSSGAIELAVSAFDTTITVVLTDSQARRLIGYLVAT